MKVNYEMPVDVTSEQAWSVLSSYGNVGSFHSSLKSSKSIKGSDNEAELGCYRECIIPNGKKDILVREKITEFSEGQYYTYDVYEWENFPLKKMSITYGVKKNSNGETIIYQNSEYRLKPRFLTWPMKGKMRSGARESLMAYKHYMETGEKKINLEVLKKNYKTL
ncbi:SRPBCC family protein [uncultured Algibacter sp.]|uniref:SRPBCC family protein n=1 Tax=uncultured Algibacter sp. TaxID=298659 RepID=UPI00262B06E5|nr:SRPBCC family protein [uncultured Algibacter sp.]